MKNCRDAGNLEAKLDVVIRLLALHLFTEGQTRWERALLLDKAGLSVREIARMCDAESGSIEQTISMAKSDGRCSPR